jgi:calcium-dependent protein kinase
LGAGAFGFVSKGKHIKTGYIRAIKAIKKKAISHEETKRIITEIDILKNLDHPNIVKLYEIIEDRKHYHLVTELLTGGELFDKIMKLGHFSEKMAASYMFEILSAVMYCHSNNIVHRDLKPENIILQSDKDNSPLKIIDFGTSVQFNPKRKMKQILGTPYYVAPEVLAGRYNEKCDVWS